MALSPLSPFGSEVGRVARLEGSAMARVSVVIINTYGISHFQFSESLQDFDIQIGARKLDEINFTRVFTIIEPMLFLRNKPFKQISLDENHHNL